MKRVWLRHDDRIIQEPVLFYKAQFGNLEVPWTRYGLELEQISEVIGYIKPGGRSEEILDLYNIEGETLQTDNVLFIICGTNDVPKNDPGTVLNSINKTLERVQSNQHETINSKSVKEVLSNLVSLSEEQTINGTLYFSNVTMLDGLEVVTGHVERHIQGLHLQSFIEDVMLDGEDQHIWGYPNFKQLIVDGILVSSGHVNNLNLSEDLLLANILNNTITGSLSLSSPDHHRQSDTVIYCLTCCYVVLGILVSSGHVNNLNLSEDLLLANILNNTITGSLSLSSPDHHRQYDTVIYCLTCCYIVLGKLVSSGHVNNLNLSEDLLLANSILVSSGHVNNLNLSEDLLLANILNNTITGSLSLSSPDHHRQSDTVIYCLTCCYVVLGILVSSGHVNNLNLSEDLLLANILNNTITGSLSLSSPDHHRQSDTVIYCLTCCYVVLGILVSSGHVNNLNLSQDLLLANILNNTITGSLSLSSPDHHRQSDTVIYCLTCCYVVLGILVSSGHVNNLNLSQDLLLANSLNNTITGSLSLHRITTDNLTLPSGSLVADVDLEVWNSSAVKRSVDNTITGNIVCKGDFGSSSGIKVEGLVNGIRFDKDHVMLRKSSQRVTGLKMFSSGAKLDINRLQVRRYLNNINITEFYDQQVRNVALSRVPTAPGPAKSGDRPGLVSPFYVNTLISTLSANFKTI
ncbi:hypothetical protein J6590_080793 [Homalodisca vitripennis]|nr:hypothetical protein J6590_080793 [Homalodisca vitripennis]